MGGFAGGGRWEGAVRGIEMGEGYRYRGERERPEALMRLCLA